MFLRHRLWNAFIKRLHIFRLGRISQRIILKPSLPINYRKRELLECLLPLEAPIGDSIEISGCIVTSKQEIGILPLSVKGLLSAVDFKLKELYIIAPNEQIKEIKDAVPENVVFISDEDMISEKIATYINKHIPEHRRGWVKQQVLKLVSAHQLDTNGLLIVDADTVMLRPQKWLNSKGVQNLQISSEYHDPYQKHFVRFIESIEGSAALGESQRGVSFVTHHQLMQPVILNEIFGNQSNSFDDGIQSWLEAIDFKNTISPLSEWHTYGTFLAIAHPDKIRLTQWRNKGVARNDISLRFGLPYKQLTLDQLRIEFPHLNSVSFHHYL